MTIAVLSIITVLAAITFMLRVLRWKTILRFHAFIDVVFTIALFALFAGTLTGALVAAAAGLILSLILTTARGIDAAIKSLVPNFR